MRHATAHILLSEAFKDGLAQQTLSVYWDIKGELVKLEFEKEDRMAAESQREQSIQQNFLKQRPQG